MTRTWRMVALGSIALLLLATGCTLFNRPPVAIFTRTPNAGDAPLAVLFRAQDAVDPDGSIVSYVWSFGDGATGSGVETTHIYDDPGTYAATLTVIDDVGAQSEATKMIVVQSTSDSVSVGVAIGERAPDFELPNLFTGETVRLSDLRGYVVLLDFWGSWCPPCRTSMPVLEGLREEFASEGLLLVGVNVGESAADAGAFLEAEGYTQMIPLLDTSEQETRWLYEVESIPRTFLIDRQGIVRHADHPVRFRDWMIEPWI